MEISNGHPLAKKYPPGSIEQDIRQMSLTPIVTKVFESLNSIVKPQIDDSQFG